MRSQDNLGEYTRKFTKFAVILIANRKLSETERNIMFLAGFPMPLQDRVRHRLAIVCYAGCVIKSLAAHTQV